MELKISALLDCIQDESVEIAPDGAASAERIKELTMKRIEGKRGASKRVFIIALAAALILAFGITAYAADFFGARALIKPHAAEEDREAHGGVSITQPQAVPESMAPEIAEKVENSKAAWEEWTRRKLEYRQSMG